MAPGQKVYPRSTVRKIVKAHSNLNIGKNADVLIYLNYVLFLQSLVNESAIEAKQSGEKTLTASSVRRATTDALAKFKG